MTDVELEKKAKLYANEHYDDTDENGFWFSDIEMLRRAYIAGAKEMQEENQQLKQQLKNEKQLNAEIKKRLVEVEYDCEEFTHEYCDINCKGKRKELVDLYQLISDGLSETLLKQKEDEFEELKEHCDELELINQKVMEENEQLKEYNTDLKQSLDWANERETEWSNRIEELKTDLEYAKAIIKDLLNNSHEYSRQNAEDFIKGEKK